jgi:hypothetical protein
MLKKLRTFAIALLLVPLLAMNANAYAADFDNPVVQPPQWGYCWVYAGGIWWLLPC